MCKTSASTWRANTDTRRRAGGAIRLLLCGAVLASQAPLIRPAFAGDTSAEERAGREVPAPDYTADVPGAQDQGLASADDAPLAVMLLTAVNRARATAALAPLRAHVRLDELALDWSRQLAAAGVLAHRDSLDQQHWVADQVSKNWRASAESIVQGRSVAELLNTLLASPPHRAQLLGPFDLVGIGVTVDPQGVLWATLNYVDVD